MQWSFRSRSLRLPNEPGGQSSAVAAPGGQYAPRGQAKHDIAPNSLWYFPPKHSLHAGCRSSSLNEPGWHCVGVAEPTEQAVPTGQAMHAPSELSQPTELMTVAFAWVPLGHGRGALEPGRQRCPGVHASHAIWPTTPANLPRGHCEHAAACDEAACEPGRHGV